MIKTTFALIASAFFLAGCGTQLTNEQVYAMSKPTLTLDCETGCSASYTDPRDRMEMPTNGWDAASTTVNVVGGVITSTAPWAAIGITAAEGISNAVGDNNSDNSVDSSDNSVDSSDNSDNSDNRTYDSTSDPVVVNPEVVTTPGPEVVRPEIVNPEIFQPDTTNVE